MNSLLYHTLPTSTEKILPLSLITLSFMEPLWPTRTISPFATLMPISGCEFSEPNALRRADAVARIDAKYAAHAVTMLVHVGSGALLFVLLPLQFSKRIRSRYRAVHREWMLRAVAGALGISMVRVVMLPIDVVLTPLGTRPEVLFLHSFWIGWALTIVGAEWWIRRTRPIGTRAA